MLCDFNIVRIYESGDFDPQFSDLGLENTDFIASSSDASGRRGDGLLGCHNPDTGHTTGLLGGRNGLERTEVLLGLHRNVNLRRDSEFLDPFLKHVAWMQSRQIEVDDLPQGLVLKIEQRDGVNPWLGEKIGIYFETDNWLLYLLADYR